MVGWGLSCSRQPAKQSVVEAANKEEVSSAIALPNSDMEVYPSSIIITDCIIGKFISQWAESDTTVMGHSKGDLLGVKVYNGYEEPMVVSIDFKATAETPSDAYGWVSLKYPVTMVSQKGLELLPFSLIVPVGTDVPDNWGFNWVVKSKVASETVGVFVRMSR